MNFLTDLQSKLAATPPIIGLHRHVITVTTAHSGWRRHNPLLNVARTAPILRAPDPPVMGTLNPLLWAPEPLLRAPEPPILGN
jgi:hypothetical protein